MSAGGGGEDGGQDLHSQKTTDATTDGGRHFALPDMGPDGLLCLELGPGFRPCWAGNGESSVVLDIALPEFVRPGDAIIKMTDLRSIADWVIRELPAGEGEYSEDDFSAELTKGSGPNKTSDVIATGDRILRVVFQVFRDRQGCRVHLNKVFFGNLQLWVDLSTIRQEPTIVYGTAEFENGHLNGIVKMSDEGLQLLLEGQELIYMGEPFAFERVERASIFAGGNKEFIIEEDRLTLIRK